MIQINEPDPRPNPFTPTTEKRIRGKARRLQRVFGLSPDERDDLAQDLRLVLWRKLEKFDPDRGCIDSFAYGVMRNWYRETARRLRGPGRAMAKCLDPEVLRSIVPPTLDDVEYTDRRLDLTVILSILPPPLRRVAEMRSEHKPGEIARQLGVHRGTVHRWIEQARDCVAEAFPQLAQEISPTRATVRAFAAER
jgi:RNA polymerase sigma factor (sigma-70 family)